MARKKRNHFALGVTVIMMFAAAVGVLMFIGGGVLTHVEHRLITVRFKPGGLMPEVTTGSLVMALGQKVGKVSAARIVVDDDPDATPPVKRQYLEVSASVWRALDLRSDCRIVASGPPLGGKGILEIIHRGMSSEPLAPGQYVYGTVSGFQTTLDMISRELDSANPEGLVSLVKYQLDRRQRDSLVARIQSSLVDINLLTSRLAAETDAATDGRLLFKIHNAVDRANRSLADLESLVAENRAKIDETLSSVQHATQVADTQILASLANELDAKSPTSLIAMAHESMQRLNRSLTDINAISKTGHRVVVLNADRISQLVENAVEASASLKYGIKDLQAHPWKLLTGAPSASRKRELDVHSAAREFAEAAAHLDDASSRLKSLVEASGGSIEADDPEFVRIRSELSATIDRFGEVEQALWDALKPRRK